MYQHVATNCPCCNGVNISRSPAILSPFMAKKIFNWDVIKINDSWGLRDIDNGTAYPLCSSLQCQDCTFLFLDIRFTNDELSNYYSDYQSEEFFSMREEYEPSFASRRQNFVPGSGDISDVFSHMDVVEKFLSNYITKTDKILDWGGKDGLNTPFKDSCLLHHVVDFNSNNYSNGLGIDLSDAKNNNYDLIVFRHILEHCSYPFLLLEHARSFLTESSIIYVEVPYESIVRKNPNNKSLHKKKKLWHEHINFFNPQSIEALIQHSGFKILGTKQFRIPNASVGDDEGRYHLMYAFSRK